MINGIAVGVVTRTMNGPPFVENVEGVDSGMDIRFQ